MEVVAESQSCPTSPPAAPLAPPPPPPPPPPRTMRTVRAGQSLLKPSVTAGLRLKAQEGRAGALLASAPATRRATPAASRPATPSEAPPAGRDGGSLRALIASLKKRAAEEADPKLKRLLLTEARQARGRLKSTARRAKKLSELYSGAPTPGATAPAAAAAVVPSTKTMTATLKTKTVMTKMLKKEVEVAASPPPAEP